MKTQEIADFLSGELVGDGNVEIERVAALSTATTGEIAFLEKVTPTASNASSLIVPLDFSAEVSHPYIRVPTQNWHLLSLLKYYIRPRSGRPKFIRPRS